MENFTTVYTYTSYSTFPGWIVGLGFMILSFFICKRFYKIHGTLWNRKAITGLFMLGFSTLWTLIVFSIQFSSGRKANEVLREKSYKVVEGEVRDFDPMPASGHKCESFKVSEIPFEYSDFEIIDGFHNTRSHGGPINGNGDEVRISYYTSGERNFIVKLEIKNYVDSIKQ